MLRNITIVIMTALISIGAALQVSGSTSTFAPSPSTDSGCYPSEISAGQFACTDSCAAGETCGTTVHSRLVDNGTENWDQDYFCSNCPTQKCKLILRVLGDGSGTVIICQSLAACSSQVCEISGTICECSDNT